MGALEDLRDFIYLELPQRPVIIKGTDADGNPNSSLVAKVNGSPIGTYYLRNDVVPKTLLYKAGATSTGWLMLAMDSTVVDIPILIEYSLSSKNVNNRYLNYISNIPSYIKGYKLDVLKTLKKVTILCKNLNTDNTAIIQDEIGNIIYEVIMNDSTNEYSEEMNVSIPANTDIKIFMKSSTGIDYPVVLLELT